MLSIFLPSIVLLFIMYITNFLPSFYIDSILICTISILSLTTLLIYHSLPNVPGIKMSDIWLLAVHAASFAQIILLVRMNCLSLEEEVCQRKMAVVNQTEFEEELQRIRTKENYDESAKVITVVSSTLLFQLLYLPRTQQA